MNLKLASAPWPDREKYLKDLRPRQPRPNTTSPEHISFRRLFQPRTTIRYVYFTLYQKALSALPFLLFSLILSYHAFEKRPWAQNTRPLPHSSPVPLLPHSSSQSALPLTSLTTI